jgi:thymidylate kinase
MTRRRGSFSVALVGADGAGKSTIGRELASNLDFDARYLYMGDNPESAEQMLPTTRFLVWLRQARGIAPRRGGPPTAREPSGGGVKPGAGESKIKAGLRLANKLAEESYRVLLAWLFQLKGNVVVFDRHYFADYYAYDIAPGTEDRTLGSRVHGLALRLFPKPDLIVCLDAPGEVLFARKPEGTVEALERRRQEYFRIRDRVRRFVVVDASQDKDRVMRDVVEAVSRYRSERLENGGRRGGSS